MKVRLSRSDKNCYIGQSNTYTGVSLNGCMYLKGSVLFTVNVHTNSEDKVDCICASDVIILYAHVCDTVYVWRWTINDAKRSDIATHTNNE